MLGGCGSIQRIRTGKSVLSQAAFEVQVPLDFVAR